jgi:hypothetical protein
VATYFHFAPQAMTAGTIIQPGNWGRILNSYNQQGFGNAWVLAREMIFESVRASKYSTKPSRLSCAFAFETLADANQSRGDYAGWSSLYEVELVTATAPSHRAAYNLIKWPPANAQFLPIFAQVAGDYWAGNHSIPELITKSAFRILQVVSTGPATYQP